MKPGIICPHIKLTPEVITLVNNFETDEQFLRAGGLSSEMLDKLAYGFSDSEIKTIDPNKLNIKWKVDYEDVKSEQKRSGLSKIDWAKTINLSEPIDISYEKFKFYVEDGHHRTYAAKILNTLLNVNLEIKMNPVHDLAPNLEYDDLMRCIFKQVKEMKLNETINKLRKIIGLNEILINETLTDVEGDVDLIYNLYFKNFVDNLKKTNKLNWGDVKRDRITTNILKNPISIKAHSINPCEILINTEPNHYDPNNHKIAISISTMGLDLVANHDGDLTQAYNAIPDEQKIRFLNDFTEARIKGSIHHELTHWLDDTLNNQHITNFLNKRATKTAAELQTQAYAKPINTHSLERQAQIHNIKQLYNKNKDIWNDMSFQDMINMMPSLTFVNRLPEKIKKQWERDIKMRMYRENLLGKNMFN